MNAQTLHTIYF